MDSTVQHRPPDERLKRRGPEPNTVTHDQLTVLRPPVYQRCPGVLPRLPTRGLGVGDPTYRTACTHTLIVLYQRLELCVYKYDRNCLSPRFSCCLHFPKFRFIFFFHFCCLILCLFCSSSFFLFVHFNSKRLLLPYMCR